MMDGNDAWASIVILDTCQFDGQTVAGCDLPHHQLHCSAAFILMIYL
jgi:hypothetical protein